MSIISNKTDLAINPLRRDALEILEAGYVAINTEKILRNKVGIENGVLNVDGKSFNLQSFNKIIFVGIGKCALDGASVIEEIMGDYLTGGAVIDVRPAHEARNLKKLKYFEGTHPLPSQQNVEATKEILKMTGDLTAKDLVICLISGGGSALLELPMPRFNLDTIIERTKELTAKGADIYELNAARKEMSQVKGGKFAKICAPAKVVSLIFSDVLGNDISVIASGPTVIGEAAGKKPQGFSQLPVNILLASNRDALLAMKNKAIELGFSASIETEKFSGNASEMGKELALKEPRSKTCVLLGGETTVRVPQNHGIGGRNQEMALSALLWMPPDAVLVCAASDGYDNTDHAGAIVDVELFQKTKTAGIFPESFLMRGDSYNFFKKIGDGAIYTGKLGSNVSDLCIILYK